MKMKKVIATALVGFMAMGMLAGCGGGGDKQNNQQGGDAVAAIKVGGTGPLTGGASIYGLAVQRGAEIAVEEVNALGGVQFEFKMEDDAHDTEKAVNAYNALKDWGMQISLGSVTTAPGGATSALNYEDSVFALTPSASGTSVTEGKDNVFQMCFADGNQGKVAADFINQNFAGQTIGVFYKSDDPYSNGIYEQFKANLDASVTVVETSFSAANETDFSVQIDTLKDCKFVFMPIYYTPASIFMTQAKDIMAADAVYYGCDGFDGLAGQLDLTTIPQEVSMLSHFDATATEGKAAEFIKKYTEKYCTDTLNQFGASAYDSVYALFNAMKELKAEGKEITPDMTASELCDLLVAEFTSDSFSFDGLTGDGMTWDETGAVTKSPKGMVIENGAYVGM